MEALNVLICEDEKIVAMEIMKSLEKGGYNVVGLAGNGQEALKIAEKYHPDLALMDINLHGSIDGTKVANLLKEHFEIPSIFLTAYADKETVAEAKTSSPLGYLVKPFNDNELFSTIETSYNHYRVEKDRIKKIDEDLKNLYDLPAVEQALNLQKLSHGYEKHRAITNAIRGLIDNLETDLNIVSQQLEVLNNSEEIPGYLKEKIKIANLHQDYLSSFVENLSLVADDSVIEKEVLSVDNILLEAISEFVSLHPNEIMFVKSFYPQPLFAPINMELFKQALHHLFLNAYQTNERSAVVNIGTSLVLRDSAESFNPKASPGWYVQISITDYGEGLDKKNIDKLTEPFFKNDSAKDGLGLGLTIVHNIIDRHDGWVTFDGSRDVGTSVQLFIPESSKRMA